MVFFVGFILGRAGDGVRDSDELALPQGTGRT